MATKKKTTSKKISNKVTQIVQTDIFRSIAIASVLLNILFLITIVVLTSTATFDRRLYNSARERYCDNTEVLASRAKELGSEKSAAMERQVDCIGKDFKPFYKEALDKYKAQSSQN
jgi:hypothetical protein